MKGNPLTLAGMEVKEGDKAPDFVSLLGPGNKVSLSDLKGNIKIFNVVVSVDTPVCDAQTKRFAKEVQSLPDSVEVLTVSMDLPFTQSRYLKDACIDAISCLSDHEKASFGESYGVLINENRLLARAVFVIDEKDIVRHVEYVKEVADEPDYEAAFKAVKSLL